MINAIKITIISMFVLDPTPENVTHDWLLLDNINEPKNSKFPTIINTSSYSVSQVVVFVEKVFHDASHKNIL